MENALSREAAQYVTLGVDQEVFAIDVDKVHEILDMRPIAHVPNAPAFMMGIIDVRGRAVPVIDLRIKLGLPGVPPTEHTRIVVLDVAVAGRQMPMGLVADRVFEVTPLSEQTFEAAPDIGVRWHSKYIEAIGRHRGDFVIIFDLARLFSSTEAASLVAEA